MVKVILTRSTDKFIGLNERAYFANGNDADLFISYHLNSAINKSAAGYEEYTYPTQNKATIAARNVYRKTIQPVLRDLAMKERDKKTANFAVLRVTSMPAILVELGFISNNDEYVKLTNEANFELLAQAHATAIKAALQSVGKSNGTVCLDAGHGGYDPGAVNGKNTEAAYVLRFVLRVKALLEGAKPISQALKEEMDEMAQTLGETAKKDMRKLLKHAYDNKIFSIDHTSKVDKMTRGEALDLLISYNARTLK